jgi:hypothetical protein
MIFIQTEAGFAVLQVYPKSMERKELVTKAEVIEDPCLPAFRALQVAAGKVARFKIGEEDAADYSVTLAGTPSLEPGKVMFRRLTLTKQ